MWLPLDALDGTTIHDRVACTASFCVWFARSNGAVRSVRLTPRPLHAPTTACTAMPGMVPVRALLHRQRQAVHQTAARLVLKSVSKSGISVPSKKRLAFPFLICRRGTPAYGGNLS